MRSAQRKGAPASPTCRGTACKPAAEQSGVSGSWGPCRTRQHGLPAARPADTLALLPQTAGTLTWPRVPLTQASHPFIADDGRHAVPWTRVGVEPVLQPHLQHERPGKCECARRWRCAVPHRPSLATTAACCSSMLCQPRRKSCAANPAAAVQLHHDAVAEQKAHLHRVEWEAGRKGKGGKGKAKCGLASSTALQQARLHSSKQGVAYQATAAAAAYLTRCSQNLTGGQGRQGGRLEGSDLGANSTPQQHGMLHITSQALQSQNTPASLVQSLPTSAATISPCRPATNLQRRPPHNRPSGCCCRRRRPCRRRLPKRRRWCCSSR